MDKEFAQGESDKAYKSFEVLERDFESRRMKAPNGRRAFFRAVSAAIGISAFKEKIHIPSPFLIEGEMFHFLPQAEGHEVNGVGGPPNRRPHRSWRRTGNHTNNTEHCTPNHNGMTVYYPKFNATYHWCHHWIQLVNSRGQRMCHSTTDGPVLFLSGTDQGGTHCYYRTEQNPKGSGTVRVRRCVRNNDVWTFTPADAVVCPPRQQDSWIPE